MTNIVRIVSSLVCVALLVGLLAVDASAQRCQSQGGQCGVPQVSNANLQIANQLAFAGQVGTSASSSASSGLPAPQISVAPPAGPALSLSGGTSGAVDADVAAAEAALAAARARASQRVASAGVASGQPVASAFATGSNATANVCANGDCGGGRVSVANRLAVSRAARLSARAESAKVAAASAPASRSRGVSRSRSVSTSVSVSR